MENGKPGNEEWNRWAADKGPVLSWKVEEDPHLPHFDHVEMSGRLVSMIVEYGADSKRNPKLSWKLVFPTLRTIPNNTHASLAVEFKDGQVTPFLRVNGEPAAGEKLCSVAFDGVLRLKSRVNHSLEVSRAVFPSPDKMAGIQLIKLKNISDGAITAEIHQEDCSKTFRGVYGVYRIETSGSVRGETRIMPGGSLAYAISYSGRKIMEPVVKADAEEELAKREAFVRRITGSLRLNTPEPMLDRMFEFSKIRAAESIFKTKCGLMHSPGGGPYYAAVWTNDQAEYAGPFVPFLGDEDGNEAALNGYRLYMPFMGPDFMAIPSSIISEGIDIWEGAGDRGDAAMYLYGSSRYALALGSRSVAEEIWPAVDWCVKYCRKQKTPEGVIASDSDELEGRFPSGKANLSTSSLAYGGLRTASKLAAALGRSKEAKEYNEEADKLESAIENYFGSRVGGFDTYRYYDGNDVLRSWICLPLVMGIMRRREGTVGALFSPKLWTKDGLATQEGEDTFWDRSTLYGFRGVFTAGETEKALQYLLRYTRRRLLGEHVPYAVEACPEGSQRHLSAESALYCRVFMEGMFGIEPESFTSFTCTPRLPKDWNSMSLNSIRAFGHDFSVAVARKDGNLELTVTDAGEKRQAYAAKDGEGVRVELSQPEIPL